MANTSDHSDGKEEYDYFFKILLVGDSNVGKTCLLLRYVDDTFTERRNNVSIDFKIKTLTVEGKIIKVQVWDTVSKERFTTSYYRGAQGILVMYDTTDMESYTNVKQWLGEIDRYAHEDVNRYLVGTKCDLEKRRAVPTQLASEFATSMMLPFIETSAKLNIGADKLFLDMVCSIKNRVAQVDTSGATVLPKPTKAPKKKFYDGAAKFLWDLYWPREEALKLAALERAKSTGEYILNEVGLTNLPKNFGTDKLSTLTCVNLSKNNMPYFPVVLCANLSMTLVKIILSHNYITSVPAEINRMGALTTLDLSYNCISSLPEEIGYCSRLVDINLEHNALNTLPATLSRILQNASATLKLSSNPNLDVPSAIYSDRVALLHYLLQAPLGEETRWNQVKLVILGSTAVGKTSLCQHLHGTYNKTPLSTDGVSVNLTPFTINNVEFCSYDFGGQVILQETHQFFLTGRSLFVLVFNLARMHEAFIEFYLTQVMNLVTSSIKPPIILVGTHADTVGFKAQSLCTSIQQQFTNRGLRIVKCLPVNAQSGTGLPALKTCLVDVATELIQQKTQTMQWSQFCDMARSCGIDSENISNAALFFHEVGSLLYFKTVAQQFDIIVINPQFLASLFSTVISVQQSSFIRDGILEAQHLPLMWKQFPPEQHPFLLSLLEYFNVMIPLKALNEANSSRYLIPYLLPTKEPTGAITAWPTALAATDVQYGRIYNFQSLPMGLFGRVLVRLLGMNKHHASGNLFWKNNAIIVHNNNVATTPAQLHYLRVEFVCVAGATHQLHIYSRSARFVHPTLFCDAISAIDTCLESFYTSITRSITKEVVCNHCQVPTHPGDAQQFYFRFSDVVQALDSGKRVMYCQRGGCDVVVDSLVPDLSGRLGGGTFGEVFKCTWAGKDAAWKTVKQLDNNPSSQVERFSAFKKEAELMAGLDCPYVIQLVGVTVPPSIGLIMEFASFGDLHSMVLRTSLDWRQKHLIALDTTRGLEYLHSLSPPIVHRDLRSPNVLIFSLSDSCEVIHAKISDLGLSQKAIGDIGGTFHDKYQCFAPEVFSIHSKSYNESSDVYALAMVFFELASGTYPYDEFHILPKYCTSIGKLKEQQLKSDILEGLRPTIPESFSTVFSELLPRCWSGVPHDRPKASQIVSRIEQLLHIPPVKSHGSIQEKLHLAGTIAAPACDLTLLSQDQVGEGQLQKPVWSLLWVGNILFCGCEDGQLVLATISTTTNTEAVLFTSIRVHESIIYTLAFCDNRVWCGSCNGLLHSFSVVNNRAEQPLQIFQDGWIISSIGIVTTNDKQYLWCGTPTDNCCIAVVDTTRKILQDTIQLDSKHPVSSIKQYKRWVWVGCQGTIVLFDCTLWQAQTELKISARHPVFSMQIHEKNEQMWCAAGPCVAVCDANTAEVILRIEVGLVEGASTLLVPIVQDLCIDEDTDIVWCSDSAGRMHAFFAGSLTKTLCSPIPDQPPGRTVFRSLCMSRTSNGKKYLWASTISSFKALIKYQPICSAPVKTPPPADNITGKTGGQVDTPAISTTTSTWTAAVPSPVVSRTIKVSITYKGRSKVVVVDSQMTLQQLLLKNLPRGLKPEEAAFGTPDGAELDSDLTVEAAIKIAPEWHIIEKDCVRIGIVGVGTASGMCTGQSVGDGAVALEEETLRSVERHTITFVNLSGNNISDEGVASLAKCLKVNSSLQKVKLKYNGIGPTGAQALAECLPFNRTLRSLSFSENGIATAGAEFIASTLSDSYLERLDASVNSIESTGCQCLLKSLLSNSHLRSFDLSLNNIGASKGSDMLKQVLESNNTLTKLTLGMTALGAKGAQKVAAALSNNCTLKKLDLILNTIGDQGASCIAESLTTNHCLEELFLARNGIGPEGAKSIAEMLCLNQTLKVLDLSRNFVGGKNSAERIATALCSNKSLKVLNLSANGIRAHEKFSEMITVNTTLRVLNMASNCIDDPGGQAIAQALLQNESLRELYLPSNNMTLLSDPFFAQVVDKSDSLNFLHLSESRHWSSTIQASIRRLIRARSVAIAMLCAHLSRCGAQSGLRALSPDTLQDIVSLFNRHTQLLLSLN
ncbi:leucine-rich repeat-containing protein [Pelomyxa schiedti]|nr:leucine-rich repeat-containing protein [Pelomyxa schiedti]